MTTLSELVHPHEDTERGAKVVLLNTGAVITAEDEAMLQALYSRDPGSVFKHLETLAKAGSGKIMSQYYVGYGHKSIGDCGTITLFVEGVSMLVAKAIQDWMLYSGQECSTRYLDFSNQPFIDPIRTEGSGQWLNRWRALYLKALPQIREHLVIQFPVQEVEKEGDYNKAIKARAFDIARCLLPAGAATNLSWHANLRQTADKLKYLRNHPLQEVREVAEAMERLLMRVFPNSFSGKRYEESETYVAWWMNNGYYLSARTTDMGLRWHNGIDHRLLNEYRDVIAKRPEKTELPKQIGECGSIRFEAPLDFGSFRDLQRQRAVVQRMPLLSTSLGFEPWYLDSMPSGLAAEVQNTLEDFQGGITGEFTCDKFTLQYLTPMGYRVPCSFSGDLAAQVYLVELRATTSVHPTLQKLAHRIGVELEGLFRGYGLKLYVDWNALGRFDIRRGTQDIVRKSELVSAK